MQSLFLSESDTLSLRIIIKHFLCPQNGYVKIMCDFVSLHSVSIYVSAFGVGRKQGYVGVSVSVRLFIHVSVL